MGLFSRNETCCICNQNEGDKKLSNGMICKNCFRQCGGFLSPFGLRNVTADTVRQAIDKSNKNQQLLNIFHPTKKIEKYFEVDEDNKLWRVPSYLSKIVFSYNEIINFELLENGEAITKGGLGSAIVGGALFGGVGAVVGGLTGSKRTKQEITEYKIKIVTKHPFISDMYINFLTAGKIKSNSFLYRTYAANAQKIISLLSIMVNSINESSTPVHSSPTDEIIKYKQLLDDGIITSEEFDKKKKQLLEL